MQWFDMYTPYTDYHWKMGDRACRDSRHASVACVWGSAYVDEWVSEGYVYFYMALSVCRP